MYTTQCLKNRTPVIFSHNVIKAVSIPM